MDVSFIQCENVLKTLPLSYYFNRDGLSCRMEKNVHTSCYIPEKELILISYSNIESCMQFVNDNADIETIIRSLLYHELSHVILTHKCCFDIIKHDGMKHLMDIFNIFEDERIETLLRDFYISVDFRKNILLINGYASVKDVKEATNATQAFYNLVRFHITDDPKWLNRISDLIITYQLLNSADDEDSSYWGYKSSNNEWKSYINDVKQLYLDFTKKWREDNKDKDDHNDFNNQMMAGSACGAPNSSNPDENATDATAAGVVATAAEGDPEEYKENAAAGSNSDKKDDKKQTNRASAESDNKDNEAENAKKTKNNMKRAGSDIVKIALKKSVNKHFDPALTQRLSSIVDLKLRKDKRNNTAITAYSGRFNVRSVIARDDYKWWTQQNRLGHINQFSKVHFNLFIDNSGSFAGNTDKMNTFIRSLEKIVSKDFTFDVITINTEIVEWPTTQMMFSCGGGTNLSNAIKEVIRRHNNKRNTSVYNIVVFDGEAHGYSHSSVEPFKHFDIPNTILVVDSSNEEFIKDANLGIAKVKIINDDYCEHFIEEVCKLLEKVF